MADIKALPRAVGNEPVPDVIRALEDLLSKARTGYIRALGFSYVRPGHRASYGWTGIKDDIAAGNALHSGLMTLWTSMGVAMDENATDADTSNPSED